MQENKELILSNFTEFLKEQENQTGLDDETILETISNTIDSMLGRI